MEALQYYEANVHYIGDHKIKDFRDQFGGIFDSLIKEITDYSKSSMGDNCNIEIIDTIILKFGHISDVDYDQMFKEFVQAFDLTMKVHRTIWDFDAHYMEECPSKYFGRYDKFLSIELGDEKDLTDENKLILENERNKLTVELEILMKNKLAQLLHNQNSEEQIKIPPFAIKMKKATS